MIRVRTLRVVRSPAKREGESSCRGCERCRSCVLGGYLAWLAKVMKDQCIHLLCTMLCHVVPCSGIYLWHTSRDQQCRHLAVTGIHGWSKPTFGGGARKPPAFNHFCRRAAVCLFAFCISIYIHQNQFWAPSEEVNLNLAWQKTNCIL